MQDVFERLIKNAEEILALDEDRQVAYISVVAKNRALDVVKRERTLRKLSEELAFNAAMTMDVMLNNSFVDEYGFSIEMRSVILDLEPMERDIVIMKYGMGYTYREIAKMLKRKEAYVYYKSKIAHNKLNQTIVEKET